MATLPSDPVKLDDSSITFRHLVYFAAHPEWVEEYKRINGVIHDIERNKPINEYTSDLVWSEHHDLLLAHWKQAFGTLLTSVYYDAMHVHLYGEPYNWGDKC